jgi:hypothetical protein
MVVRIGNILLIVALLAAMGGQWAVLQSVAWVGMVASYSQNTPLKEALTKTFDGKHPCCLCKAIAATKKSEKKNEFTSQFQKIEFPPLKENPLLIAPANFQLFPLINSSAKSLGQKPLTPPPREFFV